MAEQEHTDARRPRRRGHGRGNRRGSFNNSDAHAGNVATKDGDQGVVSYAPPMRNARAGGNVADGKHNAPPSEHVNLKPDVRGSQDAAGERRNPFPRRNNNRGGAKHDGMNAAAGRNDTRSNAFSCDHNVEAVAALAQTILAPPQMAQLIRRLSSVMPVAAAPRSAPAHVGPNGDAGEAAAPARGRGRRGNGYGYRNGGRGNNRGRAQ